MRPKGPVPVVALEWRIREDIPVNLIAVKRAAEGKYTHFCNSDVGLLEWSSANLDGDLDNRDEDWGLDETLGSYIMT